jgi:hypothetical protein
MTYIVVKDTREKKGYGWFFRPHGACAGTVRATLAEGDYSIQGLEKVVVIERKGSVAELAHNILEDRFEAELIRLDSILYPYLLLEFTMEELFSFPAGSDIPIKRHKYIKVRGPFIYRRLVEIEMNHRVRIVFCGKLGRSVATSIFKRVTEALYRGEITNPETPE